ncbi:MAG: hypothetical protein COC19_05905 [SAR86 cluster bacterium]|uniref:Uncharacterized protein n=1 Tax=SAR86 cluster bacterium TaxID=2030880 RepID=A0A2A4MKU7_9GAMM|nr:MAG: hypothetical protein COC19_05905 [SAR86 cluster bacterium]
MKHFDIGSILIVLTTLVLFTLALFFTGFTHDILLEAGVFLVSVKLIVMAYKSSVSSKNIENELREIKSLLNKNSNNSQ